MMDGKNPEGVKVGETRDNFWPEGAGQIESQLLELGALGEQKSTIQSDTVAGMGGWLARAIFTGLCGDGEAPRVAMVGRWDVVEVGADGFEAFQVDGLCEREIRCAI